MSAETSQRLVYMANQIARNFAAQGEDAAIAATADHIRLFWDPRMKSKAFELLGEPDCGFSHTARAALSKLFSASPIALNR